MALLSVLSPSMQVQRTVLFVITQFINMMVTVFVYVFLNVNMEIYVSL